VDGDGAVLVSEECRESAKGRTKYAQMWQRSEQSEEKTNGKAAGLQKFDREGEGRSERNEKSATFRNNEQNVRATCITGR
jgi:hypothetical protein